MNEMYFCEKCNNYSTPNIKKAKISILIKDDLIDIEGKKAYCSNCSNEIFIAELEEENNLIANKQYRVRRNLITPDEIREIRKIYGISQALFSRILGIGEATIRRYELGTIPSQINSSTIRAAKNPEKFLDFLLENKNNIAQNDFEKLNSIVNRMISSTVIFNREKIIKNIHRSLNVDNFLSLSYVILKRHNFISSLTFFRYIWKTDNYFITHEGKRLTGLDYNLLSYGYVPVIKEDILLYMKELNFIELEETEVADEGILTKIIMKNYSFKSIFDLDTEKIINEIII